MTRYIVYEEVCIWILIIGVTCAIIVFLRRHSLCLKNHFSVLKLGPETCSEWDRSSHSRCSVRKVVLRNFVKFTWKHLCQRLFFNKVAGLSPAILFKKRLFRGCFPVNFAKFLRTPRSDFFWWRKRFRIKKWLFFKVGFVLALSQKRLSKNQLDF